MGCDIKYTFKTCSFKGRESVSKESVKEIIVQKMVKHRNLGSIGSSHQPAGA